MKPEIANLRLIQIESLDVLGTLNKRIIFRRHRYEIHSVQRLIIN